MSPPAQAYTDWSLLASLVGIRFGLATDKTFTFMEPTCALIAKPSVLGRRLVPRQLETLDHLWLGLSERKPFHDKRVR